MTMVRSEERVTEREWRLREELRQHWAAFCDADIVPANFIDKMQGAGFVALRPVTGDDLQSPFAADRGIYKGGFLLDLTQVGRDIVDHSEHLKSA